MGKDRSHGQVEILRDLGRATRWRRSSPRTSGRLDGANDFPPRLGCILKLAFGAPGEDNLVDHERRGSPNLARMRTRCRSGEGPAPPAERSTITIRARLEDFGQRPKPDIGTIT